MQNDFSQQNDTTKSDVQNKAEGLVKDAKQAGATIADEAKQAGASIANEAKQAGASIASEAKQMVASSVGEAKEQAKTVISDQKGRATEGLDNVAGALRRTGQELSSGEAQPFAQYAEAAAEQVERFSGYLKNRDIGELVNDVRDVAQRQPELFVAGALAAGFLIGRFLKSSGSSAQSSSYGSYNSGGGGYGYANYGQPSTYGSQYGSPSSPTSYGSTQYGSSQGSSQYGSYGSTWNSEPASTQDIPISEAEEQYGR